MPGIFLAAPTLIPGLPGAGSWPGLSFTWLGWDGTEWNLAGDRPSGVALKPGVRGLTMPEHQQYLSDGPAVPGARWRGARALPREVFWPLGVYQDSGSQAWLDYDRAFWRTMHPQKTSVWSVTQPSGESRSLRLRFVDDGSHAFDIDPSIVGWATYGITLMAEQPFWEGQPVTRIWKASDPVDFFGAGAPDFHISSGSSLATATMPNLGDEDAFPLWTVIGPTTTVEVGVAGRVIEVPFATDAGRMLVVDPRLTAQTAIEIPTPPPDVAVGSSEWDAWLAAQLPLGVERTTELGEVDFAPIPAGATADLSLAMVGTGMVTASLIPLYRRAW